MNIQRLRLLLIGMPSVDHDLNSPRFELIFFWGGEQIPTVSVLNSWDFFHRKRPVEGVTPKAF